MSRTRRKDKVRQPTPATRPQKIALPLKGRDSKELSNGVSPFPRHSAPTVCEKRRLPKSRSRPAAAPRAHTAGLNHDNRAASR